MLEQLITKVVGGASRKVMLMAKDVRPPRFENVMLGGIPPEFIATMAPAESLLTGEINIDNSINHYLEADPKNGWIGECRIRFLLTNERSKPLRILGINPNKTKCDFQPASSVLFPAQGALMGEAIRFESDLDKDQPSMKRFDLVDCARRYRSEEYYFDEGFIEIDPERANLFSLVFKATDYAYRICPSITYETRGLIETSMIPLKREVFIFPIKCIDKAELFRRSFSFDPPYMVRDEIFYQSILQ